METKIANDLNELLGLNYTEEEAKEYVLTVSLSSNQKIITISDIKYFRKKSVDVLGNIYNSEEKFKKFLKK